jgi:hypothetical protein
MPRTRQHHRRFCDDPHRFEITSPSGRVVIDVCPTCGFRIKVDGQVLATVSGSFERRRFLRKLREAAEWSPVVPAAELRGFAQTGEDTNPG